MTKMNPEIKAAWLTALRSGEYEQGTAALRIDNKFCCLGVLCDIAIKQFDLEIEVEEQSNACNDDYCPDPHTPPTYAYEGEVAFLPAHVRDWAGMETKGGLLNEDVRLPNGDWAISLYSANDGGMTFSQIADVIEEQF